MTDQERNRNRIGDEVREGIRAGLGILSALKDAVEETVDEMLERGEITQERARETVRSTMERAQAAFDDARMRMDFVPRREFEALQTEVAELRRRLDAMAGAGPTSGAAGSGGGPDIPVSEG